MLKLLCRKPVGICHKDDGERNEPTVVVSNVKVSDILLGDEEEALLVTVDVAMMESFAPEFDFADEEEERGDSEEDCADEDEETDAPTEEEETEEDSIDKWQDEMEVREPVTTEIIVGRTLIRETIVNGEKDGPGDLNNELNDVRGDEPASRLIIKSVEEEQPGNGLTRKVSGKVRGTYRRLLRYINEYI